MPLNALQRETLYNTVTSYVDTVLEQPLDYALKINWLRAVISQELPSVPQTLQTLQQHPNLIQGLATAVNVPPAVRGNWATLVGYVGNNLHQLPPAQLLQQLEMLNNYNPVLMAAMQFFDNALTLVPELNGIRTELICLRELYLEMTPLSSYSYGDNYLTFHFRIGNIPLNLDQYGPMPIKGEIQSDIVRLIEDRIEQAEKNQQIFIEQQSQRKALEAIAANTALREQDLSFAVNLFLNDMTEQQRQEQFKREVASTLETPSALNQPISLSALLFKKRPSHAPETSTLEQAFESKGEREQIPEIPCTLYLVSPANLATFVTTGIQRAVLLSFNDAAASSSSGARSYQAYFIEQGEWVTESNEKIKIEMGDLNLSAFEEGLLKENAETLVLIEQAERKRCQLHPPLSRILLPVPQPVSDRRFLQMQAALSNRITQTLFQVQQKMIALDTGLKESSEYLELRKAEFCKVLLDVQFLMIPFCHTDTVHWNTVNDSYQNQLEATYKTYIEDMCVKWMSNRVTNLSGAALEAATASFRNAIDNVMRTELKSFKEFSFSAARLSKLEAGLVQRKNKLDLHIQALKEKWDNAIMPLATLADQCGVLRKLRTQIQHQDIRAWHDVLQTLCDIAKHTFQEAPNTLDAEGFSLLHYACWSGHVNLVKGLIAQGESIFVMSQEGYAAPHYAVENTSTTAIPLLELLLKTTQSTEAVLALKSKRGKILLHVAASNGNLATVAWLLQKLPHSVNTADKNDLTPLHEAARNGHSDAVQHLLALGANGRALNQQQETPIVLAVLKGHIKTAQVFFDNGIWLNKAETSRCLKAIEKHRNPQAVIESLSIPFTDTVQSISELNGRLSIEAEASPPVPGYFPLLESSRSQARLNIHISRAEASETKHFALDD